MAERNLKMIDYDLISVINHGIAVSNLAYQVGEVMGLPKDQCYELAWRESFTISENCGFPDMCPAKRTLW